MTSHLYHLERRIVQLSIAISILASIIAFVIAWYSQSIVVFVDGAHTLITIFVDLLALYAIKKIYAPANRKYQYGYYKLEPVVINLEAALVIIIVAIALVLSFYELLYQSTKTNIFLVTIYALLIIPLDIFMWRITKWGADKINSEILRANSKAWYIDIIITMVILISFSLAWLVEDTWVEPYIHYIDPILAIIIVLVVIRTPLQLMKNSLNDLLDSNRTKPAYKRQINKIIHQCLGNDIRLRIKDIRITQAGRSKFVDICYLLPLSISRKNLMDSNKLIRQQVQENLPNTTIDFFISFDQALMEDNKISSKDHGSI